MSQRQTKHAIKQARRFCQKEPHPFNIDTDILEVANYLFILRESSDPKAIVLEKYLRSRFHKCVNLSSDKLLVCHR
jgi:hypothetical protein